MISFDNSCFARMICCKSVKAEFHSPFSPASAFASSLQTNPHLSNIISNLTFSDLTFVIFKSVCVEFCKLAIIRIDLVA